MKYLCCTHCGKQITYYSKEALDFEGFIYCSMNCINKEVIDYNYFETNTILSENDINTIIELDGGVKSFNWSILNC